jgi:hypothetical protein
MDTAFPTNVVAVALEAGEEAARVVPDPEGAA